MKLVSYLKDEHDQLAMLENNLLYDTDLLHMELPSSMSMFLNFWDDNYILALKIQQAIKDNIIGKEKGFPAENAELLAPVPFPASCRNGSINNTDQRPSFYFSNHHNVQGEGAIKCMPDYFNQLNFQPGFAVVIAKPGRNIPAEEADEYIAGLTMLNVFVTGKIPAGEPALNAGFATAAGPYFVTIDELEEFETATENHIGKAWDITIECSVNDKVVNTINANDMRCTFAELIELASYGATLYPGDIISSGIIKQGNKDDAMQELKEGDVITIKAEALSTLTNTIEREDSDFSLIEKNKSA